MLKTVSKSAFNAAMTGVVLAMTLGGCATDRTIGEAPSVEVANLEELPAPTLDNLYVIGPQEVLNIEVVGADRLTGTYLTDGQSQISFPLLGLLSLDGLEPSEAASRIASMLRGGGFLLDPEVRVIPATVPARNVSVGGEVTRPGEYPVTSKQSLIRVINLAGGLDDYAESEDVLILRTVEGQQYIGAYNLDAIQRGNYPDPEVYPNDIIYVGDSPARRRLERVLQFVPLLSSSVILIDRIGR